ncbi:protein MTSS 1-like isoform X2 [Daphnia carinata]|uniref:protein MTSS 1-like isoform X2 n=1 Tax=Daphnia carinata TaxID=120202 RepID=UPI0025805F2B|nr:protein MTSS 1-like isoform X2 [Daphnia carinata]
METLTVTVDKEFGSAMGALFHQIITDMKVGAPLWEDFLSKASKLHTALKSTLSVIAAYLDAFQKIADSATNAKGATKDIGTVLTRICLRHKAVEARLKTFTSALMECLVLPLHDKLEEWKKMVVNLDKEHSKEYKKVRADIKKRTAEAQRWQKKAKKIRSGMAGGGSHATAMMGQQMNPTGANDRQLNAANQELLRAADAAQIDLNSRLALLQETEKQALKSALVEERSRYCLFVACLKPVMSEEMSMMAELSHLEEIITQLDKHTADPFSLPSSTEQMISELKGTTDHNHWALQTPPSSPSSLGSRKSSMCSLGSIHSSSSGSVASHSQNHQLMNSPSHAIQQQQQQHIRHRSLSQVAGVNAGVRLSSVSSQDSGFTSQDTLVLYRPNSSPPSNQLLAQEETVQYDRQASNSTHMVMINERPHTISTAYEKGHHQRAALSVYTFQPLEQYSSSSSTTTGQSSCTSSTDKCDRANNSTPTESPEYETLRRCRELKAGGNGNNGSQESLGTTGNQGTAGRPPLPQRCSSLERPVVPPPGKTKSEKVNKKNSLVLQTDNQQPSILPDFHQAAPDMIVPQPVYMNASELRQQAAAMNGDDPASHAIYTSLASCTVYEDGQACSCHGPSRDSMWRHQTFPPPPPPACSSRPLLRRPASFSGYVDQGSMGAGADWNPRGSVRMSTMKRTSIPSFATLHEVSNVDEAHHTDDVNLVPPLPEVNVVAPSSVDEIDLAALPPPPDFLLETAEEDVSPAPVTKEAIIPERSLSVADAVKTLNEIRHQPASPGVVRRAQSMRATSDSSSTLMHGRGNHPPAVLAKTLGTTPKAQRHSDQHHAHHTFTLTKNLMSKATPANHNKTLPKQMPSHPTDAGGKVVSGLLSKSSFVHQLNAKLAQQQQGHSPGGQAESATQRHSRNHHDGQQQSNDHHRESLMDQIRRGTSLRRARSTSDRSSPHFKH